MNVFLWTGHCEDMEEVGGSLTTAKRGKTQEDMGVICGSLTAGEGDPRWPLGDWWISDSRREKGDLRRENTEEIDGSLTTAGRREGKTKEMWKRLVDLRQQERSGRAQQTCRLMDRWRQEREGKDVEDTGGFLTTVERRGDPSRSGRDWWILGCNGVNLRPQDTRRKLHGVSLTARGLEGGYQGGEWKRLADLWRQEREGGLVGTEEHGRHWWVPDNGSLIGRPQETRRRLAAGEWGRDPRRHGGHRWLSDSMRARGRPHEIWWRLGIFDNERWNGGSQETSGDWRIPDNNRRRGRPHETWL